MLVQSTSDFCVILEYQQQRKQSPSSVADMVRGEMGDANENVSWKRLPIADDSGAGDGWRQPADGATHCGTCV